MVSTGKSLSEALRLQNMGRTYCVQKLFLTFRTIFVHNMFSPRSAKRRASDKDLPVLKICPPYKVGCIKKFKVASSNTFHLKAHAGFFRLLVKGILDPYVLRPFDKKLIS